MDKVYLEQLDNPLIEEDLRRLDEKEVLAVFSETLVPYVQVFEKSTSSNISKQATKVCKQQFPFTNTKIFYSFICFLLVTKCKVAKSVGLESYINIFAQDKKVLSIRSNAQQHRDDKPTLNFTVKMTKFFPEEAMLDFDYTIGLREEIFGIHSDEFIVEIDSPESLLSHTQFFGDELKGQIDEMLMN